MKFRWNFLRPFVQWWKFLNGSLSSHLLGQIIIITSQQGDDEDITTCYYGFSLSLFVMLCSIIIQNGSRFFPQNIQMRWELHREKIIGFWFHHQTNKYIFTIWLLTRYNIIQNSTRHFPVFSNQTHTHAHVTNFIFFFALHCLQ